MNKWVIAAALIICTFISCSKHTASRIAESPITGKWELRASVGGFAGTIRYEPGEGPLYTFDADKTYKVTRIFTPGASPVQGTYEIKESSRQGDFLLTYKFVNMQTGQPGQSTDSVRFDKNQLIILPVASCCDIPTTILERVLF